MWKGNMFQEVREEIEKLKITVEGGGFPIFSNLT